jgi:hypothetical protein
VSDRQMIHLEDAAGVRSSRNQRRIH